MRGRDGRGLTLGPERHRLGLAGQRHAGLARGARLALGAVVDRRSGPVLGLLGSGAAASPRIALGADPVLVAGAAGRRPAKGRAGRTRRPWPGRAGPGREPAGGGPPGRHEPGTRGRAHVAVKGCTGRTRPRRAKVGAARRSRAGTRGLGAGLAAKGPQTAGLAAQVHPLAAGALAAWSGLAGLPLLALLRPWDLGSGRMPAGRWKGRWAGPVPSPGAPVPAGRGPWGCPKGRCPCGCPSPGRRDRDRACGPGRTGRPGRAGGREFLPGVDPAAGPGQAEARRGPVAAASRPRVPAAPPLQRHSVRPGPQAGRRAVPRTGRRAGPRCSASLLSFALPP